MAIKKRLTVMTVLGIYIPFAMKTFCLVTFISATTCLFAVSVAISAVVDV